MLNTAFMRPHKHSGILWTTFLAAISYLCTTWHVYFFYTCMFIYVWIGNRVIWSPGCFHCQKISGFDSINCSFAKNSSSRHFVSTLLLSVNTIMLTLFRNSVWSRIFLFCLTIMMLTINRRSGKQLSIPRLHSIDYNHEHCHFPFTLFFLRCIQYIISFF